MRQRNRASHHSPLTAGKHAGGRSNASAQIDWVLMDGLFECYLDWKEACSELAERYACWQRAEIGELAAAFGAYDAALDAEEDAAATYQELFARTCATLN